MTASCTTQGDSTTSGLSGDLETDSSASFIWRYQKDGSISDNADAAWIDDLQALNGVLP